MKAYWVIDILKDIRLTWGPAKSLNYSGMLGRQYACTEGLAPDSVGKSSELKGPPGTAPYSIIVVAADAEQAPQVAQCRWLQRQVQGDR